MGRRHFNVFIIIFCIQTLRVECGSTSSVTWEAWWMTHNASSTCPFPWQIPLQRSLLQLWKGINIGMRCVLISNLSIGSAYFERATGKTESLSGWWLPLPSSEIDIFHLFSESKENAIGLSQNQGDRVFFGVIVFISLEYKFAHRPSYVSYKLTPKVELIC